MVNDSCLTNEEEGTIIFGADSYSSDHFVKDSKYLKNLNKSNKIKVRVADNRQLLTTGTAYVNETLPKVHYIPEFTSNLLSIPKLYEQGYVSIFHPNQGLTISRVEDCCVSTNKPVLRGYYQDGCFKVPIQVPRSKDEKGGIMLQSNAVLIESKGTTKSNQITVDRKQLAHVWFQRLGLAGPSTILKAAKNNLMSGITLHPNTTIEDFGVEDILAYHEGKSHKQAAHPLPKDKKKLIPMERIHIDTKVIGVKSYQGFMYAVVIVDEATSKKWIVFLRSKSDLPRELTKWHATKIKPSKYPNIKAIRLDNAGEQKSYEFEEFLIKCESIAEYTSPYSSQSNGRAERSIRTIFEKAEALRFLKKLPQRAWAECTNTATYLLNMLPCSSNENSMSPNQAYDGIIPDVSKLRAFGCTAFVHIPNSLRNPLDPKATQGILVGYSDNGSAYRIMTDIKTGKIVTTKHVTFAETVIPLQKVIPSTMEKDFLQALELFLEGEDLNQLMISKESFQSAKTGSILSDGPIKNESIPDTSDKSDIKIPDVKIEGESERFNTSQEEFLKDTSEKLPSEQLDELNPVVIGNLGERPKRQAKPVQRFVTYQQTKGKAWEDTVNQVVIIQDQKSEIESQAKMAMAYKVTQVEISYEDALNDPLFRQAIQSEKDFLISKNAVMEVDLPPGRKAITSRWVFSTTPREDGSLYARARLCPRGFQEIPGVDYDVNRISAPTLSLDTAMLGLHLITLRGMHIMIVDGVKAFLTTTNHAETYLKPPKGWNITPGKVLKLLNSLQGLKQGAFDWYERAHDALMAAGFKASKIDSCFYWRWDGDELTFVMLWVDDFLMASDTMERNAMTFQELTNQNIDLEEQPPTKWLGMNIDYDRIKGVMKLDQADAILSFCEHHLPGCSAVSIPAVPGLKLNKINNNEEYEFVDFPLPNVVGEALWYARTTRPDIWNIVKMLSQHTHCYSTPHVQAAKRLIRYLKGSYALPLILRRPTENELKPPLFTKDELDSGILREIYSDPKKIPIELTMFVDSDFAGEPQGSDKAMRSTTGLAAFTNVGLLYANCHLQQGIAHSTADAEYRGIGEAVRYTFGARDLLEEIGFFQPNPTVVYNDNAAAVTVTQNPLCSSKFRHILISYHFIREAVKKQIVKVVRVDGKSLFVDMLTKSLDTQAFVKCRDYLLGHSRWVYKPGGY